MAEVKNGFDLGNIKMPLNWFNFREIFIVDNYHSLQIELIFFFDKVFFRILYEAYKAVKINSLKDLN